MVGGALPAVGATYVIVAPSAVNGPQVVCGGQFPVEVSKVPQVAAVQLLGRFHWKVSPPLPFCVLAVNCWDCPLETVAVGGAIETQ